jgi:DNA-directed RNA polymerase specialized sigma24 family protein
VVAGVISANQAEVVAQTRLEGRGLAEVAKDLGRPYNALQKDRRRAEHALRFFARRYGAEGPT